MSIGGRDEIPLWPAVLILCSALASFRTEANPLVISKARDLARGVHDPSEKIFNVLDFKAKPDGKTDSAINFIQAWNAACKWKGKSRLFIPPGKFLLGQTIFQGPCVGPKPIVVQIKGTLLSVTDPSEFTSDEWILFEDVTGMIVLGGGTVDGQGASVWKYSDCDTNENCARMPVSIRLNRVTDAIVRKLSSVNAKGFHIALNFCTNVRLYNLRIVAPGDSPNTDGIHISRSNLIKIGRSEIGTGDDCVSMIQGCTNISIKKVTCGPGHGFSVGSLGKYKDEADVRGILVKNCTLTNTDNGVRIKTWPDSPPSKASALIFQNIVMNNVKNPIVIDQEYNFHGKTNIIPSRVAISDVHYLNIKGTTSSKVAVSVVCSKQFPCQKMHFQNINLKYTGGQAATSNCRNAQGVQFGGFQIPPVCR